MKIPEYYLYPDFWRRLVQMAKKLLQEFPKRRYDNDLDALIEDVIQEMFLRIHKKEEPEEPIARWPGFFYRVMQNVIFEERDDAFRAHQAGWERASGTVRSEEEERAIAVEEQIADPATPIDGVLELPKLDESEARIVDPRFWRMVNEELPKIADEQCRECFRRFVHLVWYRGRSRRAAWKEVEPDCHGDRWATFCRWQKKLGLAVMKRWAKSEPEPGGGV